LGLGFLVNDVMIGAGFDFFDDVIGVSMSRFCGSKFYWLLSYNASIWSPFSTF